MGVFDACGIIFGLAMNMPSMGTHLAFELSHDLVKMRTGMIADRCRDMPVMAEPQLTCRSSDGTFERGGNLVNARWDVSN